MSETEAEKLNGQMCRLCQKIEIRSIKKLERNLKCYAFSKLQQVLNCSWNSMWGFLAFSFHSFYTWNSSLFSDLFSFVLVIFYLASKLH